MGLIVVAWAATQPIIDPIAMARGDGRILLAGLKGRRTVEIISDRLIKKRLSILSGPGSTPETMARAAEVLNTGGFPTAALLGEVYALDELDEALDGDRHQEVIDVAGDAPLIDTVDPLSCERSGGRSWEPLRSLAER